jgi:hypothetical protein
MLIIVVVSTLYNDYTLVIFTGFGLGKPRVGYTSVCDTHIMLISLEIKVVDPRGSEELGNSS